MRNNKLGHIGLATNDIEKDADFYVSVLGFKIIGDFKSGAGEQVYFLEGNGFVYEMFQPLTRVEGSAIGKIDHIALESTDIEKDYAECVKEGCTITTNGIEEIATFWEHGVRYFKIASPTGEQIEYCQVL